MQFDWIFARKDYIGENHVFDNGMHHVVCHVFIARSLLSISFLSPLKYVQHTLESLHLHVDIRSVFDALAFGNSATGANAFATAIETIDTFLILICFVCLCSGAAHSECSQPGRSVQSYHFLRSANVLWSIHEIGQSSVQPIKCERCLAYGIFLPNMNVAHRIIHAKYVVVRTQSPDPHVHFALRQIRLGNFVSVVDWPKKGNNWKFLERAKSMHECPLVHCSQFANDCASICSTWVPLPSWSAEHRLLCSFN